jgi:hypothetical protein
MLLRDVLHAGPDDALVQQCCDMVLSLCLQCASSSMGVEYVFIFYPIAKYRPTILFLL